MCILGVLFELCVVVDGVELINRVSELIRLIYDLDKSMKFSGYRGLRLCLRVND